MRTAEEILKECSERFAEAKVEYNLTQPGIIEAMKVFAEQAFNAGRERIDHPDWDFIYDDSQEYLKELE